jgi:DNA sulfur modification protein DndD
MILEELTVRNFCLYRGEQSFDLTPVTTAGRHRPIVLFGGINGGGKTTLLDAIQLALYGSRARCSKRVNLSYEEFLRTPHTTGRRTATCRGRPHVSLALDGEEHHYDVRRTWQVSDSRLRGTARAGDGVADGWIRQLAAARGRLFPLDISQLFFFDAEKIRTLAEDESSSRAGGAIKSLLGLDIVERLIADSVVLRAVSPGESVRRKSAQTAELEQRVAELHARVQQLVGERADQENKRLRAVEEQRTAEAQFASAGGRHWEEREGRRLRLQDLESQIRDREAELCGLAAGELPLAMVGDLLTDVERQDERERHAAEGELIDRLLTVRDGRLLAALKGARAGAKLIERIEAYLRTDREGRRPKETTPRRLDLTDRPACCCRPRADARFTRRAAPGAL